MDLTISQDIFLRGLQKIQGIVERKNALPILSNFLLTAGSEDTVIHATDLELGYEGYLDTTVNQPGTTTLPARKTLDIVRELTAGDSVSVKVESDGWAHITSGSSKFKVPCLPADEYPELPAVDEAVFTSIDGQVFNEMIRHTIFATSQDETRYTLSGVLMTCEGGNVTMVATDGHRLAHVKQPMALDNPSQIILPRKALEEVSRFTTDGESETIEIALLANHVVFRKERATLVTRLIEGQFPDYQGVIPKEHSAVATVGHEGLLRALRRVSLLSNEKSRPVRIDFDSECLTLRSNTPEIGEASDQIPVEYEGDELTIGFNARYLMDALAATSDNNVCLEITDAVNPVIFRPSEGDSFFCVIMPMRV
ncbi:MAG: DNA polymerase III subunit beta [Candidatus Tectomicrobia bacterium]|nr:DNA polymerase III subunit beta [Candidatus Tectomicrobia bacterium]